MGSVTETGQHKIGIRHAATARHLKLGASVAVNGCCLTVAKKSRTVFFADLVPETLSRTNLGGLRAGSPVNLELSMPADGVLDGHLVQGHVDAKATVKRVIAVRAGKEVSIDLPAELKHLVAEKGSIAVDGVSLTVARIDDNAATFMVALIPHTLTATIASKYTTGTIVNLEADVLARYVARNLHR